MAADAELTIEVVPVAVRCQDCGAEGGATSNDLRCARCASVRTQLIGGDECDLIGMDLEFD